jgi:hypothetical protein
MPGGKEGYYHEPSDWAQEFPHTIYFYYAEPVGAGKYAVRAYLWVNPDNDPIRPGLELDGLIKRLTSNARDNVNGPGPIGSGFTVPWWRISYFVIALDDTDGFEHDQAIGISHIDGSYARPNHTFFDGWDGAMEDTKNRPIAVAYTVNHMKTRYGENLGNGEIHRFKLKFKPKGRPFVDDGDSGTNMGPPVPPP